MILGQVIASINVETWQAFGAFVVIAAVQITGLFEKFIRYKNERDDRQRDYEVNDQILGNLKHISIETEKQNLKLDELNREMSKVCRVKAH